MLIWKLKTIPSIKTLMEEVNFLPSEKVKYENWQPLLLDILGLFSIPYYECKKNTNLALLLNASARRKLQTLVLSDISKKLFGTILSLTITKSYPKKFISICGSVISNLRKKVEKSNRLCSD